MEGYLSGLMRCGGWKSSIGGAIDQHLGCFGRRAAIKVTLTAELVVVVGGGSGGMLGDALLP